MLRTLWRGSRADPLDIFISWTSLSSDGGVHFFVDKENVTDVAALLAAAMASIEKDFGAGAVIRMDQDPPPMEVIPSGSIALNLALGVGGWARGRAHELYGPESSGKSTLALAATAACQASGGTVFYLDSEHALDPLYAKALGVRIDELVLSQPSTFEEGMEIALRLVRSGAIDLLIVDSVAAMTPRTELESDVGDANVGLLARLMSQSLRKITPALAEHGTCAIFINQLRDAINSMGFGPREITPGGRALKFYASTRVDVRRIATIKDGDEATANRTRVKIVKNKCAPPLRVCEFDILYGEGISREGELVDLGVDLGIIKKAGAWLKYADGNLAQGRNNAMRELKASPTLAGEIERLIAEAAR